ncbi:hypothetical protein CASFOL_012926 [Castilleja foliolosa]|uniref:Disease resistance N-terminal domain-containing protein n=1 Tax=Castilleja foliolosa TaxID=1961234 RepID=A0ABD3DIH6_9LAMI
MAEVVVGPIVQVFLQDLLTLSKEQFKMVKNFKDDLENLQKTCSMVKYVLKDAEKILSSKRLVTDNAVKCWLRDLEYLALDADNFIDEINYHLLYKKSQSHQIQKGEENGEIFLLSLNKTGP